MKYVIDSLPQFTRVVFFLLLFYPENTTFLPILLYELIYFEIFYNISIIQRFVLLGILHTIDFCILWILTFLLLTMVSF